MKLISSLKSRIQEKIHSHSKAEGEQREGSSLNQSLKTQELLYRISAALQPPESF